MVIPYQVIWGSWEGIDSPGGHSCILENYVRTNIGPILKWQLINYKLILIIKLKLYIELHGINKLGCL